MERNADGQTIPPLLALPDPDNIKASEVNGRPSGERGEGPLARQKCVKVTDILAACNDPVDWDALTKLATSRGGFLDDEVRQVACRLTNHVSLIPFSQLIGPCLLGYRMQSLAEPHHAHAWHDLPRHKDEDQVELDVNRSFIYYPKSTPVVPCRGKSPTNAGQMSLKTNLIAESTISPQSLPRCSGRTRIYAISRAFTISCRSSCSC